MRLKLCNVPAVLQIAARNVQRQLRAVEHAFEHQHILGDDLFYVVCDEHLIVVQLYLAVKRRIFVCEFGEVENTLEVERVVRVYVDVEQRIAVVVKDLAVERFVVVVRAFARRTQPQRVFVVERLGEDDVAVFVFVFLAVVKVDVNGHERAVFFKHLAHFCGCQKLLFFLRYVHYNVGAAPVALG